MGQARGLKVHIDTHGCIMVAITIAEYKVAAAWLRGL